MGRGYPVCHELKSWPVHFEPVFDWRKRCEIRVDDRGYEVGDFLLLREYGPQSTNYTGRWAVARVTHIVDAVDFRIRTLPPDVAIMSFVLLDQSDDAPEPEPA